MHTALEESENVALFLGSGLPEEFEYAGFAFYWKKRKQSF